MKRYEVCWVRLDPVLRREMAKQRWNPMGIISPGSPGLYEEQYTKALRKHADYAICNTAWFNPKSEMTKIVGAAFKKRHPKDLIDFHGTNVGYTFDAIMIAAAAFARAKSSDPKALADAIRTTNIRDNVSTGPGIQFDAKGQNTRSFATVVQWQKQEMKVVYPQGLAVASPIMLPLPPWDRR